MNTSDLDVLAEHFAGLAVRDYSCNQGTHVENTVSGTRSEEPNCGGMGGNKNKGPGKTTEPDFVHQVCGKCGRTKDIEDYINNTLEETEKLREENRQLRDELGKKNMELRDLSDKMAQSYRMNNTGRTEISEDKMCPSKIANKFQSIYDGVYQELIDNCKNEREGIEQLRLVLSNCYKFAEEKARMQIHLLLSPGAFPLEHLHKKQEAVDSDEASEDFWEETTLKKCITDEDLQELYRIRYKIAQHEDTVKEFKMDYKKNLHSFLSNKNITIPQVSQKPDVNAEDVNKNLAEFYDQCAECCWLMATCRPSIQLKFPDQHTPFIGEITKWFQVTERDDPVKGVFSNRVTQLIWPAVVQQRKGKITVFKEGRVYVSAKQSEERPIADREEPKSDGEAKKQTTI